MMRRITIFIILSLLFSSAYSLQLTAYSLFAADTLKEEEALFVAKKAFDDAFYDVSLGLLERFLKSYPDSSQATEANLLIGQCYFHQNRFLDALAKFESLLDQPQAKNMKDAIYYWIAEVHFKGNNFDRAAQYYQSIIKEFPGSPYVPAAYYSLGWCLFQENKFADALKYFKIVEEKYSKDPHIQDVPFKIIECLYNLKDYGALKERLKADFKTYAKDTSRLSYLYFYLAEAEYELNNFNEAIEAYTKVIQISRDEKVQVLSKLGKAWVYLKLKRYKESQDAFADIKEEGLDKKSLDVLLLGKAVLMSETNRLNEAKNLYDRLLKTSADRLVVMQAYLGKADALFSLAEYDEAINVYKEASDKMSSESVSGEIADKLHYNLAWVYLKQGEFKEAIKEFKKIVKESDDKIIKVSALCQIGDAYQDSGDHMRAQETYDTILKDYPDSLYSDYVQYQMGLTLLKNSNYDGAILAFLTFKRNYPKSKLLDDATYALGSAYFQKQDYKASREVFEKFQDEFRDSSLKPQALYLLGASLYNLERFPEAIEVFKGIIAQYGQNKELVQKAEYEIADCYSQMGNENEAITRFKQLRSKYPDSGLTAEIMWWLGEYYYRHNDLEAARKYFSSLIQDFPKSNLVPDAYYALGSCNEEESKHEEALMNFKKVIELTKSDLTGQAAIAIADIYIKQDKSDMAIKTYQDIIRAFPNLVHLIYPKIADLYYKTNDYDESLDFCRKSLDVVPVREMAGIQLKIAEVKEAQGKIDEAVGEYLKVTYVYPQDTALVVKALLRVGAIYEDKEKFKEAANIYGKVASMDVQEAKFARERIEWIKAHTK